MFDADNVTIHTRELGFAQWLRRVDTEIDLITGSIGLTRKGFADWCYAAAFANGMEPRQAAIDMLAEDRNGYGYLRHAGIENNASFREILS